MVADAHNQSRHEWWDPMVLWTTKVLTEIAINRKKKMKDGL